MNNKRRILAIGGGGFMMEDGFTPIDRELLRLTGKQHPKICLIPTPTGDAEEVLQRFYAAGRPVVRRASAHPLSETHGPLCFVEGYWR